MSYIATTAERVHIALGERSYDILIGRGLLLDESAFAGLPSSDSAVIVTNTTIGPLYSQTLKTALCSRFARVHLIELPDGETYKDWATLNLIFDRLLGAACDRK